MKKREFSAFLISLFLFALFLIIGGAVLTPERVDYGATWEMYREEDPDSVDAMVLGSSIAYCDTVPAEIWNESGLYSYVMAGPEQTVPTTYWYIREAVKTQSPQAVLVEATGMFYPRYTSYTRVNVGYMPWGFERLAAVFTAAEQPERFGLLFPVYNYHDRWYKLTRRDIIKPFSGSGADMLAGYTYLNISNPIEGPETRDISDADYERNLEYAGKIVDFCNKNGITCVFWLAPEYLRPSDGDIEKLRSDIESTGSELWIFDRDGYDVNSDWYDMLHLNYHGAVKFSEKLSRRITESGVASPSGGRDELWRDRLNYVRGLQD